MKLVSEFGLMDELHLGKTKSRQIGAEAKARVKIGRRVLYDLDRVYAYIETLRDQEEGDRK